MRKILSLSFLLAGFATAASAAAPPPDEMAWQVFVAMTTPANTASVKAVAFETWALDSDIYTAKPHWPGATPGKLLLPSLAAEAADHGLPPAPKAQSCYPKGGAVGHFPVGACIGEEVRHNRPIYDAIVNGNLFTVAGLVAAHGDPKPVTFPSDSIVVKADWIAVATILRWLPNEYHNAAEVRRAYYTNMATYHGKTDEYALAGMSVQSKQIPQWLWMTFEHRSNPGRCDDIGCHDAFGAAVANVAPAATNSEYGPCAKSPALAALFAKNKLDAVWNNYCLKGTQTQFVKPDGQPAILANSVIERMNKGVKVPQTSCITCHAYASFDGGGQPNYGALKPPPTGAVSFPLPAPWKPYDYMWGLISAP